MAKRLLPFRQYNEHDVVNMFALEDASVNENITGVGAGDAGVFVKVTAGNLDLDPVAYGTNAYLGKTDYPYVGFNQYPCVSLKVAPASGLDYKNVLGITLWETAKYDENGEKLLYYPQKAAENQVLLPGQAVPVLTKGIVTIDSKAFVDTALWKVGNGFKLSSADPGKVTGVAFAGNGNDAPILGTILATGSRSSSNPSITDKHDGKYAVIKLGL
jgi:hypothetical protein